MIFKLKRRGERRLSRLGRNAKKHTEAMEGSGHAQGRGRWGWRGWGMGTPWSHWRRGDGHPCACVGGGPGVAPAGGALGCGPSTCCPSPCITTLCRDGNICELSLQEADIKLTMRKNGVDGNKKGTAWHLIKQISINNQF